MTLRHAAGSDAYPAALWNEIAERRATIMREFAEWLADAWSRLMLT